MRRLLPLLSSFVLVACGSSSGTDAGDDVTQLPPTTGAAAVEAWLADGHYKAWHCETDKHAARAPSPHGVNRICNNAKLTAQPAGPGEYPVGAAAVKELYTADGGTEIIGYAVEVHVSAGKNTSNWYWYEKNPAVGAPAKNGEAGLVADGVGPNEGISGGPTDMICTGCHSAAGSDAAHTTTDSHDFVYTHVP
ncbi:MAG: hypothetical protein QM723_31330 [Myxococcaceae bacterium]